MLQEPAITRSEEYELDLVLQVVRDMRGYDFGQYRRGTLHRQLRRLCVEHGTAHYTDLISKLIYDKSFFGEVLQLVLIGVTELFRDPVAYQRVQKALVPYLSTYAYVNIWHIGCSTGEEVYSMAILLKEAQLLQKTQLYATDLNERALDIARKGIYPMRQLAKFTHNYKTYGGQAFFSDYYHTSYDRFAINQDLRTKAVFSRHNLTSDGVFAEVQVVCCRNVLIYFNLDLQNRVLRLIYDSLDHRGYLWLGERESLHLTEVDPLFELIDRRAGLYRKKLKHTVYA